MDNNDYLLYNSLVMEMFILSFAELNRLITLTLSESEKMIYLKAGILVVDEEVDIKVKEDIKKNYFKKRNKINTIYIITSTACNLNCSYCSLDHLAPNNNDFSEDRVRILV